MREILFRGQCTETGDWIKGHYVRLFDDKGNRFHRIYSGYAESDCGDLYPDWFEVDLETVGQFTGLTDKNGKKIFEGDIVKALRICNQEVWTGYVVMWNGCFALKDAKTRNVPAIDLFNVYEVIGNIHDNPDLMENK